jgi:hypothetical protein
MPAHFDSKRTRPSLLIQFLRAIGPGTVLWKSAVFSRRNDGSSHELLRRLLPTYEFLAIPDAHFSLKNDSSSRKARLNILAIAKRLEDDKREREAVELNDSNQGKEDDSNQGKEAIKFVQTYLPAGRETFRRWKECIENYTPGLFKDWVSRQYDLPDSGPIVIIGSPEGCLGYDYPESVGSDNESQAPQFREMMDKCGYASTVRLNKASEFGSLVIHKSPTRDAWEVRQRDEFRDISLIFMSRTSDELNPRIVVVLAGAANSYGTFAAVSLATDHRRQDVSALVHRFSKSAVQSPSFIAFRTRPKGYGRFLGGEVASWKENSLSRNSFAQAVDARFIYQNPSPPSISDLHCRQQELRLAAMAATPFEPDYTPGPLVKHFAQAPSPAIIVKTYPEDLRDDGIAKDLVEFYLPKSTFYPLRNALPTSLDHEDSKALKDFRATLKFFRGDSSTGFARRFRELDGESALLIEQWNSIAEFQDDLDSLSQMIEANTVLPSEGPVIVIGAPESFLGGREFYNSDKTKWIEPAFRTFVKDCGYPNRFETHKSIFKLFDNQTRTDLKTTPQIRDGNPMPVQDLGFALLTRDSNHRDVLIIAGVNWLGTLAGVELLFVRRLPVIDNAVMQFIEGKRSMVEVAFRCERMLDPGQSGGLAQSRPELRSNTDDLRGLRIELLAPPGPAPFVRGRKADLFYRKLIEELAGANSQIKIDCPDEAFGWQIGRNTKKEVEMIIDCNRVLEIPREDSSSIRIVGEQTFRTLREILGLSLWEHRRLSNQKRCCISFLILGEMGVGKEDTHLLLHVINQTVFGSQKQPVVFNIAQLDEGVASSEIFGYDSGAFTGSRTKGHRGLIEQAADSTVFFDECFIDAKKRSDIFQQLLLSFMEKPQVLRAMKEDGKPKDVRVQMVCASNYAPTVDVLRQSCESGAIRGDFVARFSKIVDLNPLRERPAEILPAFIGAFGDGKPQCEVAITLGAFEFLVHYHFPDNFRHFKRDKVQDFRLRYGDVVVTEEIISQWLGLAPLATPQGIVRNKVVKIRFGSIARRTVLEVAEEAVSWVSAPEKNEGVEFGSEMITAEKWPAFHHEVGLEEDNLRTIDDFEKTIRGAVNGGDNCDKWATEMSGYLERVVRPIKEGMREGPVKSALSTPLGVVLKFCLHIKSADRQRAIETWTKRGQTEREKFDAFRKTDSFQKLSRECQIVLGLVLVGMDLRQDGERVLIEEIVESFKRYNRSNKSKTVNCTQKLMAYIQDCQGQR